VRQVVKRKTANNYRMLYSFLIKRIIQKVKKEETATGISNAKACLTQSIFTNEFN
jgi:hypothetical protein